MINDDRPWTNKNISMHGTSIYVQSSMCNNDTIKEMLNYKVQIQWQTPDEKKLYTLFDWCSLHPEKNVILILQEVNASQLR